MRVKQTETGKPDTAFLLSIALRPLRLDIPYGTMKTSFQRKVPTLLSTGTGDEIPGFPNGLSSGNLN
jgi:hypothetical protein